MAEASDWRDRSDRQPAGPVSGHLPPQNLDAEEAILGAMITNQRAVETVVDIGLREGDFYRPSHQVIFAVIQRLADRDSVDELTVVAELKRQGRLEEVGGPVAIMSLVERTPTVANARAYAQEVLDQATLRQLVEAGHEIARLGYEHPDEPVRLVDMAGALVTDLAQKREAADFVEAADLLGPLYDELTERAEAGGLSKGLPTGFADFDRLTGGLQSHTMVIVAARPAMGKTSWALNVAEHVALREKKPVALFSLEMGASDLVTRIMCSVAKVDQKRIRVGLPHDSDWPLLVEAVGKLMQTKDLLYIDQSSSLTPMELRSKVRRLHKKLMREHGGLALIIIDYLQLMDPGKRLDNRQVEVSYISRQLKSLSLELGVPIMALSQLSRGVEMRTDKRPLLGDLRECVTGETLVVLADGRRVPIAELAGTTPTVLAISKQGRIVEARSDRVWKVGKREVFEVRLASGRSLRATARHRVLGWSGWVRVDELGRGTRLAMARRLPEPAAPIEWLDSRVIFLGQMIGDGSYLRGQPMRYTTSSDANSEAVRRAAEVGFGCTVTHVAGRGSWHQLCISGNGNRWHPAGANAWLRELGIFGQRSHEKRVPAEAFQLSNRQLALLLRHLWATDGSISVRRPGTRGSHGVYYATNSTGLALDIAALLLRLGIVARLAPVRKQGYRDAWHVRISGAVAQRQFLDLVGGFGPRAPGAWNLSAALAGVQPNTNVDTVPREAFDDVRERMRSGGVTTRQMARDRGTSYGGSAHMKFAPSRDMLLDYASILEDDDLAKRAMDDVFWDAVVSIDRAGCEDVYDLTVPGPASWLADGVASHNSGALEQDSDIVVFLHRPEYYDKDNPELQGKAEVIVAKHRNGETGSVWLGFLARYTKFVNLDRHHSPPPVPVSAPPVGGSPGGGSWGGPPPQQGNGGSWGGPPPGVV